jgi:hypothetical protein
MRTRKLYLDQYNSVFFASTLKELKAKVCPYLKAPKTSIMYLDKPSGKTVSCGYVVSNHWLVAYVPEEVRCL